MGVSNKEVRLISPPLFFIITYKVWPDSSSILLDGTDNNPNGWHAGGVRAIYTDGIGAEIYSYTNNYWGGYSYKFTYGDFCVVFSDNGSNIPSDITSYTQFALTFDNISGSATGFSDFWLAYTTSESDTTGTYLCRTRFTSGGCSGASSTSTTYNSDGTLTCTFDLYNQYTTKPYRIAFGCGYAEYSDNADEWYMRYLHEIIHKIELLA